MSVQKRWVIPLTIVALCILITTVIIIEAKDSPKEPKPVYTINPPLPNTDGVSLDTPTTPNIEAQADGAEITPLETAAGAVAADDLEPFEARFDDESTLDAQGDETLSPEEREKRFKIANDFFDELDREFANIDADREALTERVDELEENYFAYIDAIADLLSPKYQRRFDEIATHDELTQAEVDGINDELQVIGKELGIEIDDYMQRAAEEFFEKFTSLNAAIDKLYEKDEQLIKEMEEFTHEN